MNDCYETKAALLAAKENTDLPVFVSNAYGADGKLMTGATPLAMVAMLEGMGADAIGVNCSLGPTAIVPVVKEYIKYSSVPVIVKPNAGLPKIKDGKTVYDLYPSDFAEAMREIIKDGASVVGGCCGTTPEYIGALVSSTKVLSVKPIEKKKYKLVSSYTHAVEFGDRPILIGERINPTGKPRLREAIKSGNSDFLLREALGQQDVGADILDVNVGVPGIDESAVLTNAVCSIQAVCDLPLQLDSSDPVALESALRRYNGKAMINSVNGKAESMASIFPLVKKYGGVVVCLTLDEGGIPNKADGRFEIAKKIYHEAAKYGIEPKDLIFDPLAMAVSADKNAARETLRAVKLIGDILNCHTSLGVSNVSFGLPSRDVINAVFFNMALENGLSAAIMNPYSKEMMQAYHSYLALSGYDVGFEGYIASVSEAVADNKEITTLRAAVIKGLKDRAKEFARELLKTYEPLKIINEEIIPALNEVGDGFENKKIYLPSLLMSAEAAGAAFDVIKSIMPEGDPIKCPVVLATVKGDIHDIGKNIVKLVLENYGFAVTDLGKDVDPEKVADEVVRLGAKIVGLSALMTTTLPAMEETIRLVRGAAPDCKIMVGGAVLTEEYARYIGADFYGRDAMEAVKYAEKVNLT